MRQSREKAGERQSSCGISSGVLLLTVVAEVRMTLPGLMSSDSYLPQLGEKSAWGENYFVITS